MKNFITHLISDWLHALGFIDWVDFKHSLFNTSLLLSASTLVMIAAAINYFMVEALGLGLYLYVAFAGVIIMEIVTGISAAKKLGKEIEGPAFMRTVSKLAIYSVFLFLLNMFAKHNSITVLGTELNIWSWVYWMFFTGVSIQLTISILNNFAKMGYKEARIISKLLGRKFQDIIKLDDKDKDVSN